MADDYSELSGDELWRVLAVKAQNGDQRAYAHLLRDIVPYIRAVAAGSLANPDWVDDLVQDAGITGKQQAAQASIEEAVATISFRTFWFPSINPFRPTAMTGPLSLGFRPSFSFEKQIS